jgi:hypothetical protein
MRMAIIMTYRPDEMSADKVHRVIYPPESEGKPLLPWPVMSAVFRQLTWSPQT